MCLMTLLVRFPHFWRGNQLSPISIEISQVTLRVTAEEVQVFKTGRIII